MADVTVKQVEEFDTNFGGMKLVRHGLGVESFGIQLLQFPANATQYPEHDHSHDGQEEVYTVVEGKATLSTGGQDYELTPGVFARVGPNEKRKITTADEPAQVLALGATPGAVFKPNELSIPQG